MFMVNFALTKEYKYSLRDIEGLIPWERDAYLVMLRDSIDAENERIKAENAKRK